MKPLDPRLLRYARAARGVLLLGAGLGLIRTVAVIAWCWCLSQALSIAVLPVLDGMGGMGGMGGNAGRVSEAAAPAAALPWFVLGGVAALLARAATSWGMDAVAARGAVRVKAELRGAALDALDARSPIREDGRSDAELTTVLGRGLDALDGYFSGYIPQLILTAVATPLLILAVLLADPLSGIIVLIVFPIIPIFMILIGLATQAVQDRQWVQLQRLSASFMDAVSGLATLKIFGREGRQAARIARETDEYRSRTMQVLRVTFLSGFVLDLAGAFSIALVAVTVGTRLVTAEFPLALGLFVLLLLPEVFIPVRQVGSAFHASTEGLSASADAFAVIEGAPAADHAAAAGEAAAVSGEGSNPAAAPDLGRVAGFGASQACGRPEIRHSRGIVVDGVRVLRGGRCVVGPVSFSVAPGEVVALAGPSGAGKSTLVAALLGFVEVASGRLARPSELAWAGQAPGLLQGTVAANLALGGGDPDPSLVRSALDAAGLTSLAIDHPLGASGSGVSGGQAQRISIARALYRAWSLDTGALLLDEPTSALDPANETLVCRALRKEAERGRAVLVVSHRPAVLASADRIVRIGAGHRAAGGAGGAGGEGGEGGEGDSAERDEREHGAMLNQRAEAGA